MFFARSMQSSAGHLRLATTVKTSTAKGWVAGVLESREQSGKPPDAADARRPVDRPARYQVGQKVRTADTPVAGHTRLPAYARGRVGEIVAWHGGWVYPDTNAHGGGEQPRHLYTVAFAGDDLWGDAGDDGVEVCIDLFEPYLEEVK